MFPDIETVKKEICYQEISMHAYPSQFCSSQIWYELKACTQELNCVLQSGCQLVFFILEEEVKVIMASLSALFMF